MKLRLYLFALAALFLSFQIEDPFNTKLREPFILPNGVTKNDYLPNTVIIKLKQTQAKSINSMGVPARTQLEKKGINIVKMDALFPNTTSNNKSAGTFALGPKNELNQIYIATYEGSNSIEEVINTLQQDAQVEYAEPSYIHYTHATPNDPFLNSQTHFTRMQVSQAWDIAQSAANILVAIVDSGSDLDHEDLAANIYYNQADPINGRDDDGDGFVDNFAGWDFVGLSATTMIPDNNPNVTSDSTQHGVHVSGLVSAVTNNAKGIASIARDAKLLIVKTGADNNARAIYKGYEGIKYAVDMGAKIINCSWGSSASGQFGQEIINYAVSSGALIIASAGNDNNNVPNYPASYPGVISVSAVANNDVKSSFSNYGDKVDIAAPGTSILSTLNNGRYGYMSGTSMSAPLVSSAAALLWAMRPDLTGEQIGEHLRMASDPINDLNANHFDWLGKGRVNVLNAIQNKYYSVRFENPIIQDPSNGSRLPGVELALYFDFKNYLDPVDGLHVQISSVSPFLEVLTPSASIGNLASLGIRKQVGPIRVRVLPNAPANREVSLKLNYTANGTSFTASEVFTFEIALDYLNVNINKISTTFASNGRLGYSKADGKGGLGFVYRDESMLYEASLLIGKSSTQVSNNTRNEGNYNEDFVKVINASKVALSDADFEATATFNDEKAMSPLNLIVKSKIQAYEKAPFDKFVLLNYEIINNGLTDLEGIYTGMFVDWDLDVSNNNATQYDPVNKMGYVYAMRNKDFPYGGVKLLSLNTDPIYAPFSYQRAGDPLADGKFTQMEKFAALRDGISLTQLGTTGNGLDVMYIIGSGPYKIPAGKSVTVSYAFLAGDNLNDLQQVSQQAQLKYTENIEKQAEKENVSANSLGQNYPNPVQSLTQIPLKLVERTVVKLQLTDLQGRVIKTLVNTTLDAGLHLIPFNAQGIPAGVYIYEVKAGSYKKALKMVVVK
ncbi:MAG: T9SS type A sorting domain-containing protein [Pedobacter sp.]|nr:MAG: T9SS type A sorting domain-containing protein [Pedobacter sp.]